MGLGDLYTNDIPKEDLVNVDRFNAKLGAEDEKKRLRELAQPMNASTGEPGLPPGGIGLNQPTEPQNLSQVQPVFGEKLATERTGQTFRDIGNAAMDTTAGKVLKYGTEAPAQESISPEQPPGVPTQQKEFYNPGGEAINQPAPSPPEPLQGTAAQTSSAIQGLRDLVMTPINALGRGLQSTADWYQSLGEGTMRNPNLGSSEPLPPQTVPEQPTGAYTQSPGVPEQPTGVPTQQKEFYNPGGEAINQPATEPESKFWRTPLGIGLDAVGKSIAFPFKKVAEGATWMVTPQGEETQPTPTAGVPESVKFVKPEKFDLVQQLKEANAPIQFTKDARRNAEIIEAANARGDYIRSEMEKNPSMRAFLGSPLKQSGEYGFAGTPLTQDEKTILNNQARLREPITENGKIINQDRDNYGLGITQELRQNPDSVAASGLTMSDLLGVGAISVNEKGDIVQNKTGTQLREILKDNPELAAKADPMFMSGKIPGYVERQLGAGGASIPQITSNTPAARVTGMVSNVPAETVARGGIAPGTTSRPAATPTQMPTSLANTRSSVVGQPGVRTNNPQQAVMQNSVAGNPANSNASLGQRAVQTLKDLGIAPPRFHRPNTMGMTAVEAAAAINAERTRFTHDKDIYMGKYADIVKTLASVDNAKIARNTELEKQRLANIGGVEKAHVTNISSQAIADRMKADETSKLFQNRVLSKLGNNARKPGEPMTLDPKYQRAMKYYEGYKFRSPEEMDNAIKDIQSMGEGEYGKLAEMNTVQGRAVIHANMKKAGTLTPQISQFLNTSPMNPSTMKMFLPYYK